MARGGAGRGIGIDEACCDGEGGQGEGRLIDSLMEEGFLEKLGVRGDAGYRRGGEMMMGGEHS